ncbi:hypothetical protein OGAPHI_003599 [Ogataea philodendri]|uniref:Ubiquitin carboxyl-terminal hydrolase n=1 Tax=Ogataea philodendri TaxID=1378263 RepID=A0A9P8P559_9ASCO|nr:uncharacterized protein OGAPHI_003599 [Ogataea philodendri]KAH3665415.1 hypothetical protein OGAPHI_003599 [Ogataea philodendri]
MALEYLQSLDRNVISTPSESTPIYKDDCMFSFETAFDDSGLDICMNCFQSFSRLGFNYTKQHSEYFNHKVYLNYRKIVKHQNLRQSEQPLKMVKLEIKEQTENDLYDIKTQIYCSDIDESIDFPREDIPDHVKECASAIIEATSNDKQQEIKAWEQEIVPCPHSFDIKQGKTKDFDLTQCHECGLKENLWICLTCGSLGCGRSQFGGVPGNSHALKHYESNPTHHIAVKLGSLSLNSADSYCYTCNDDVKVPDLVNLLGTFGIKISETVKTEKTLTELQIEQNVKWDFNMSDENGESLIPVFGEGLTGLKNLGNSCYLSSVVQVLFSISEFGSAFHIEEGMPVEKILNPGNPALDLETQLFKLGDGLLSGRYSVPDEATSESVKFQKGIRPQGFKTLIGEGHPEFSTMQQQDAFEFLLFLLEKIDSQKLTGVSNVSPTQLFNFVVENKIKCPNCSGVIIAKEITNNIRVPIVDNVVGTDENGRKLYEQVTLKESLLNWIAAQDVEYTCPNCDGLVKATKTEGLTAFPDYLILSPQRIKLDNWVPVKLDVPIKFEEILSLDDCVSPGLREGEHIIEQQDAKNSFLFDESAMNTLLGMGFPENRCKRALYATGNKDAEAAMNWLFAHMEDPDIDEPFDPSAQSSSKSESEQEVQSLISMGFTETLSRKALLMTKGNVELAVEWLFSHPDDDGVLPEVEADESPEEHIKRLEANSQPGDNYILKAVVCHKGASIHSGHYVAFIKGKVDGVQSWLLFNDEKVVRATEDNLREIEKSGYIYLYERQQS